MTARTFSRLLASSLIVGSSMVACSGTQTQHPATLAAQPGVPTANEVEKALGSKDFGRALLVAEQLVEASPREAANRTLLGRAYLANGRFASARTAFEDAMTLGANDPRTIISLALVRTGLDDARGARDLLSDHIADLPAADYGLAMAISGNAEEGVRALLEAAHQPDADAKTRQNLAYALALSGNWGQARLLAGQDLDGSQVQQRMTQWAATAESTALPRRVAALVGVAPRVDDSGLPERLALSRSEPGKLAALAPLPVAPAVATANATAKETPAAQPVAVAHNDAPPAPAIKTVAAAQVQALPTAATPVAAAPAAPRTNAAPAAAPKPARHIADAVTATRAKAAQTTAMIDSAPAKGSSDWVVQVGAVDDARYVDASWKQARTSAYEQQGYRKVTGTITINGQTWHRLALGGFADRNAAVALCGKLQAQGKSCFVRRDDGVTTTVRTAQQAPAKPKKTATTIGAKPGKQLASR
jgi:Flp pilus assembly protein TadD